MIRPIVFGYVQAPNTTQGLPKRPVTDRRDLLSFTERESLILDRIYVDHRGTADYAALHALLSAATMTGIVAVVVPDWSHLGETTAAQNAAQALITDTIGVPILAADLGRPGQHP